jgi:hypothetical protein
VRLFTSGRAKHVLNTCVIFERQTGSRLTSRMWINHVCEVCVCMWINREHFRLQISDITPCVCVWNVGPNHKPGPKPSRMCRLQTSGAGQYVLSLRLRYWTRLLVSGAWQKEHALSAFSFTDVVSRPHWRSHAATGRFPVSLACAAPRPSSCLYRCTCG